MNRIGASTQRDGLSPACCGAIISFAATVWLFAQPTRVAIPQRLLEQVRGRIRPGPGSPTSSETAPIGTFTRRICSYPLATRLTNRVMAALCPGPMHHMRTG